jgi:RimJ/RimL family protein N-acetyltransferase
MVSNIRIETKRLVINLPKIKDAKDYLRIRTGKYASEFLPKKDITLKQAKDIITKRIKYNKQTLTGNFKRLSLFVRVKKTGKMVGWCNLTKHPVCTPNIDIYRTLDRTYQNKGYGTEMAKAVLEFGFMNLKLLKIVASVDPKNIKAVKSLKKCGFKYQKKLTKLPKKYSFYKNQHLYQITKTTFLDLKKIF